jgi:hypothetical protein
MLVEEAADAPTHAAVTGVATADTQPRTSA